MFDVDELVQSCRDALREATPALAVKEVVARAIADQSGIEGALGVPSEGGITTLHRSDDLTVLHIVWSPHVRLYPHDHRMWAAIGIYGGREDNAFYRRGGGDGLLETGGKALGRGDTLVLGVDAIHSVTNPLDSYAAAIHVYGGDFFGTARSEWDPQTHQERPFDVEGVRRLLAEADEAARQP